MTLDATPPPPHTNADRAPDCVRARRTLLTAEPVELERGGTGKLARHLASCEPCRALASRILRVTGALDAWLDAPDAAPDTEAILRAAEAPHAPGGEGRGDTAPPPHRSGRWKRTVGWAVPATLAAAVVGLLVLRGEPRSTGPDEARLAASSPSPSPDLDVEVPAGRNAAVFTTKNPDITVIWFMGGDR